MDIGIPREVSDAEQRVALSPAGVDQLAREGHHVFVEQSAGLGAHFSDDAYTRAGARLAYNSEEVYGRAELVLKVEPPTCAEYGLLREGQILMSFLNAAVAPREGLQTMLDRRVTSLALELIEDGRGRAPVLQAMSELAGPLAIHIAAHLLQSGSGGRGVLLGGAAGIPPATVVILGAGVVGTSAARAALGSAAQVVVLDRDLDRLRRIGNLFLQRVITMIADEYHVRRAVRFADVLIGAVLIRGGQTPHLVDEAAVQSMRPGSVIIDVSIDQGGCVETSRPTTLHQPTFVCHDVVHYAVPNMTADVARTATYALTNAALPHVLAVAGRGVKSACESEPGLARGLVTAGGRCYHPQIAERFRLAPAGPGLGDLEDGGRVDRF